MAEQAIKPADKAPNGFLLARGAAPKTPARKGSTMAEQVKRQLREYVKIIDGDLVKYGRKSYQLALYNDPDRDPDGGTHLTIDGELFTAPPLWYLAKDAAQTVYLPNPTKSEDGTITGDAGPVPFKLKSGRVLTLQYLREALNLEGDPDVLASASTAEAGLLLEKAYLPMLNGRPVNDLILLNTRQPADVLLDGSTKYKTPSGYAVIIEHLDKLQAALSTPASKILTAALLYLTHDNFYRGNRKNINPTVEIPLEEYAEACGRSIKPRQMGTPEEQTKEDERARNRAKWLKNSIKKNLTDLESVTWTGTETKGPNRGDYTRLRLISSHSIRNGTIRINFDPDAARYLVQAYIAQTPLALLKVDDRNPGAFRIGWKMAQQGSNDRNARRGTDCTLSVKSMIDAGGDIPTFEDIEARGQRNWKEKIKRPLENNLEELRSVEYLQKWEYRDPITGTTYTPEAAEKLTARQYGALMIDFIVEPIPDQTERRERSAARTAERVEKNRKRVAKKKK